MYYNQPMYRTAPTINQALPTNRNQIRVIGEGTVSVQPDKADIILGVSTENRELKTAQEENSKAIRNIITALEELGIPDENIRTSDYSIYPQYEFSDGKPVFRGYKVDHLLNVTIEDIEKTGIVVDTAVTNGANTVTRIRFSITNPDRAYNQALSNALHNAYQKALTIANTLGVNLYPSPILVTEGSFQPEAPVPFEGTTFVKAATSTPIEPGSMDVKSNVQLVYQYYV